MRSAILLACLALLGGACGSTTYYRPGTTWRVSPEAPDQIDDDDIRTAFEARPQLPGRARVAYFTFDQPHTEALGAMLRELPRVDGVYEIAPLWVTGERRLEEPRSEQLEPAPPRELSMRQLRLLAARAHCELLVVVDHGVRTTRSANGWTALAPLIVPLFFAPMVDAEVESTMDAYLIDVRNGYLYGHLTSREQARVGEQGLFESRERALASEQWAALMDRTRSALEHTLAEGPEIAAAR